MKNINIKKIKQQKVSINTLLKKAKVLKSDGEGKEYGRALVELISDVIKWDSSIDTLIADRMVKNLIEKEE